MRLTIEIDEEKVNSIIKLTGNRKKSPAIGQALDEFLEQKKRQAFLDKVMAGKTDYRASNEEVEALTPLERP